MAKFGDTVTTTDLAGLPAGGANGQVLTKNSATDYDAGWVAPSGGSVGVLAYKRLTTSTANLSMDTDVADMSVSVTVSATRLYLICVHVGIMFTADAGGNSTQYAMLASWDGTTKSTMMGGLTPFTPPGVQMGWYVNAQTLWLPSAGTKTVSVRPNRSGAGTLYFYADASMPRSLFVQDIGPR